MIPMASKSVAVAFRNNNIQSMMMLDCIVTKETKESNTFNDSKGNEFNL